MIQPSIIQQAVTDQKQSGISYVIISIEGRLLCYEGSLLQEAKAIAAIVDNAFFVYNRHGNPPQKSPTEMGAYSMLFTNEHGKIAAWKVGNAIVMMTGDAELGYLNERTQLFAKSLEPLFT